MNEGKSHWRQVVGVLATSLLLLQSALTMLAETRLNLGRVSKLHARGRSAPDDGLDQEYQRLATSLVGVEIVGLHYSGRDSDASDRALFFLTYSLAPRVVVRGDATTEYVASVNEDGRQELQRLGLELVADYGDGMAVYRRRK